MAIHIFRIIHAISLNLIVYNTGFSHIIFRYQYNQQPFFVPDLELGVILLMDSCVGDIAAESINL